MNDFQEQAKNWLRNVVKQNPDKIKAGVEKAGDLIDKQTGGKYAEKVDSVQQKVGTFVDKQTTEEPGQAAQADQTPADTTSESTTAGTAEPDRPADRSTSSPVDGPAN
ncbi:antitoxin [Kribbella sp. NPDC058693]|uniref:Antitoxin n=1 Tax=Kribbella jiaozuonensis TaxID=2575441 RepID=A0A4U3LY20_9ACTN|nr:antitoxin [Kribbella jiaozuonensis]TKK79677.1 antitoxin [Kribbella jiaozuonensis]